MRLEELKTPCALVDLEKLRRNASWARERASSLDVALRPHVKTHKCPEIAKIQLEGIPGRVTVSTLAEAFAMAEVGFSDMTWALPVPLPRLEVAAALSRTVDRFSLLVDHPDAADAVEAAARIEGLRLPVFLKVDSGYGRCGVSPGTQPALDLARRLARSPHLEFRGLLTHAGHAYRARNREEARTVAVQERDAVAEFAVRLRSEGLSVGEVSVGSTPTFAAAADLKGVSEARPGNYIFFDAFQAAIGACDFEQCAFSVLATVVGAYPARDAYVIDAGALALSKDPGPVHLGGEWGCGTLVSAEGAEPIPGLKLAALSQEHGQVRGAGEGRGHLAIGQRVRVIPNHSCLAAACFDRYHIVQDGSVVDSWRPARGW